MIHLQVNPDFDFSAIRRLVINPQKDTSNSPIETAYEYCSEDEAEIFSVFGIYPDETDELLAYADSKEEAEAYLDMMKTAINGGVSNAS